MYAPAPAAPAPAPAAAPAAPAPKPAAPVPVAASIPAGIEVFSPMAGTMYRAAAPGEPPFVREGDKVKKGQPVCIIEAMKLMNEIEVGKGAHMGPVLSCRRLHGPRCWGAGAGHGVRLWGGCMWLDLGCKALGCGEGRIVQRQCVHGGQVWSV